MVNDSSAALWAGQYVELKHDIGFVPLSGSWVPNPFAVPSFAGADQTWVEWKPGENNGRPTTDIMTKYGARSMVAPDRSASIKGNFAAGFTGSLQLPGPAWNMQLREFWDEMSDRGAQFHLKLALYQQEQENAKMSHSERLDEHEFKWLFGVTTDTPPLRVLPQDNGSEQPFVGVYAQ